MQVKRRVPASCPWPVRCIHTARRLESHTHTPLPLHLVFARTQSAKTPPHNMDPPTLALPGVNGTQHRHRNSEDSTFTRQSSSGSISRSERLSYDEDRRESNASAFSHAHSNSTSSSSSSHPRRSSAAQSHSNAAQTRAEYPRDATYDSDAPPAYRPEGRPIDKHISKRDYAIEISRIMGRQLVKSLRPQSKAELESHMRRSGG
ncbi:hypothetical protein BS50DRAFT_573668 [Corynespora cassiicola Philippines]|uniref:Uncharacterized protein n=1 Tax=Corynespora cassiicola Philippines TaxID=1448308 RepID=A0A2T2NN77_CORCC|nr:hypothetical protein BS50DRAFT_573668 [Corynespora cassiicola Philippines]